MATKKWKKIVTTDDIAAYDNAIANAKTTVSDTTGNPVSVTKTTGSGATPDDYKVEHDKITATETSDTINGATEIVSSITVDAYGHVTAKKKYSKVANAVNAEKATNDSEGNNIRDTYLKKTDMYVYAVSQNTNYVSADDGTTVRLTNSVKLNGVNVTGITVKTDDVAVTLNSYKDYATVKVTKTYTTKFYNASGNVVKTITNTVTAVHNVKYGQSSNTTITATELTGSNYAGKTINKTLPAITMVEGNYFFIAVPSDVNISNKQICINNNNFWETLTTVGTLTINNVTYNVYRTGKTQQAGSTAYTIR